MSPAFLDLPAAAIWCSVSTRTLERWIRRGLPVYRGSRQGKRLVKVADLEEFMTKQAARVDLVRLVDEVAAPFLANKNARMRPCSKL